jgi:hypothetical protein
MRSRLCLAIVLAASGWVFAQTNDTVSRIASDAINAKGGYDLLPFEFQFHNGHKAPGKDHIYFGDTLRCLGFQISRKASSGLPADTFGRGSMLLIINNKLDSTVVDSVGGKPRALCRLPYNFAIDFIVMPDTGALRR